MKQTILTECAVEICTQGHETDIEDHKRKQNSKLGSRESKLTKFKYSCNWTSAADDRERKIDVWFGGGMAKRKVYKHVTVVQWTRSPCLVQFNQYAPCNGFVGPVVVLVQFVFCVSCFDYRKAYSLNRTTYRKTRTYIYAFCWIRTHEAHKLSVLALKDRTRLMADHTSLSSSYLPFRTQK